MLVAYTENKPFILTPHLSREQLLTLRGQKSFRCPQCSEPVMLKVGKIKTPHFSHLQNTECLQLFSEGESEQHLKGKHALFLYLQQHSTSVQLEPYLHQLSQRPDILVHYNGRKYAIEFQCSQISEKLFYERTKNYGKHFIQPIWLLNTPIDKVKKSEAFYPISFTRFEQLFMQRSESLPFIISFQPQTSTFYYFSHLLHIQNNQFLTKVYEIQSNGQPFPFLKPKMLPFYQFQGLLTVYKELQKKHIYNRLKYSRLGANDILLRSFYELRLSPEHYPYFIGIPTKRSEHIPINAVEWQSGLFYYCQRYQLPIDQLNERAIYRFLQFIKQEHSVLKVKAIFSYLHCLNELGITNISSQVPFEQIEKNVYSQQLQYD